MAGKPKKIQKSKKVEPKKSTKAAPKKTVAPKAKAKAAAPVDDGSDSDSDEDSEGDPRLVPPKKVFSGEDRDKYTNWRRSVVLWRSKYKHASSSRLGACLMEVIEGDAEDVIYAQLAEGEETYSAIMGILDSSYGEKGLPETLAAQHDYDSCARGKKSLTEFLLEFKTKRAKAVRHGLSASPETDGAKLLAKCELTTTQHAGILQTLRMEAKIAGDDFVMPKYAETLAALETLAQTLAIQDQNAEGTRKRKAALVGASDAAPKWQRSDKGKKQSGKTKGAWKGDGKGQKGKGICWDFQAGKCSRGSSCRFAHGHGGSAAGQGGKFTKGSAKGTGKAACRQWSAKGTCSYGASCRFSHGDGKGDGKGPPKAEAAAGATAAKTEE